MVAFTEYLLTAARWLLTPLCLWLLLVLCIFLLQRHLLFFPATEQASAWELKARSLRFWPQESGYQALIRDREAAKATVIVFHGNAGSALHRDYYANALGRQGYRVIITEYPGYGGRPGKPGEETFVSAGIDVLNKARETFGGPIYLLGESIGSGVAAGVASRTDVPVEGLILITPFDSLAAVARTHYWYLAAQWLVRDRFDNIRNLTNYRGKVAVVLAGSDTIIPPRHGQNLYDHLSTTKRLWTFPDAGHNSLPLDPGMTWWQELSDFFEQGEASYP